MSKEKLGQEPAFPIKSEGIANRREGMSKRFYAACAAMQGICCGLSGSQNITPSLATQVIKEAYIMADELLKQEND